jgi:hypothetical protein
VRQRRSLPSVANGTLTADSSAIDGYALTVATFGMPVTPSEGTAPMYGLLVAAVATVLTVAAITLWLDDPAQLHSKHWFLTWGFGKRP